VRTLVAIAAALSLGLGIAAPALLGSDAGAAGGDAGAFTTTQTLSRDQVVNGTDQVVDTRSVTLNVSQTANLQGRQEIDVSWSGAHPTGGIIANQNSAEAQYEEYPFVLLECRGIDSSVASPAQQLTPQTCWTQTWTEHYQDSLGDAYPPYRLDEYASAAQRAPIVGAPSPLPASCNGDEDAPVQDWVPFDADNGQVYYGGNAGCAGEPPESDDVGGSALPSNETFGVTGVDGRGSADFDVFTSDQNASLGCSQTVSCALVAVPIMGISCDPTGASPAPSQADVAQCEDTGAYAPGSQADTSTYENGADLAVTGSLWWSPSNWRNRITVPLTFAPPPDACSLTGSSSSNVIDVYGSELLTQATGQWDPSFCQSGSDSFSVVHVVSGEPEARNLVATGSAEAAFTSYAQPGGYGKPVVNAPVAISGFTISYDIDGSNGQPYASLKLTPLLLAKLLTESYPGELFMQQEDPALAHNPLNITQDPEFTGLNPGINPILISGAASEAASELMALSSDSDVMEALTTYINDDPTARAWLNGAPDQWGMVVNPAYKGIQLPVDQWPLLSTFEPAAYYQTDDNDCLYNDPVPYQPLVAAPLASLADISESLQYNEPNSTTQCSQPTPDSSLGEKLTTDRQQPAGSRFMIGITPLGDDQRYLLQPASLQTTDGTFVAPGNASLQAATSLLTPDTSSGTWPIPYAAFQQSAGASAYPGTMVVYAAIPTMGLPASDAQEYASFLQFAAATGQTPGSGVSQLPPGYLPMTQADGLGAMVAETEAAAQDVAAQNGQVPVLTAGSSPSGSSSSASASAAASASPSSAHAAGASGGFGQSFAPGQYGFVLPPFSTSSPESPAKRAQSGATTRPIPIEMVSNLLRSAQLLWTSGFPVGLLFGLAALGALSVPMTYRLGRRRGRW
jgi:hypothetical protein